MGMGIKKDRDHWNRSESDESILRKASEGLRRAPEKVPKTGNKSKYYGRSAEIYACVRVRLNFPLKRIVASLFKFTTK